MTCSTTGAAAAPVAFRLPLQEPPMRQPNVTVYGSHSCPDTENALKCLDSKKIPYEYKSVDDFPELNDYLAGLNNGKRVMPTIQINNETFINPKDDELGKAVEAASAQTA